MVGVWRRVFRSWRLTGLSLLTSFLILTFSAWVSNLALIGSVLSADVSIARKLEFLISLYGLLVTNFSLVSAVSTVTISVLAGINLSLLIYYISHRRTPTANRSGNSASLLGLVSGLFGIGCAACGSVILTGLFSSLGALVFLSLLPLHGAEFGLLGVGFLAYSVYELTKRINDPQVCPIS
jgi:hypothetical protein